MTPIESRRCPGGCGRTVHYGLFACGSCWHELPPYVRRKINKAWRTITDADGDPTLLPAAIAAYEDAAAEATVLLGSRLGL